MSLDSAVRGLAQRAVHGMGQAVTLSRVSVGSYNTATGTAASSTVTQELIARLDEYMDREFTGTVQVGDRKVILAAMDMDWSPKPKDKVLIGDITHDVVTVKQDMAASLPAIYTLQIRPIGG